MIARALIISVVCSLAVPALGQTRSTDRQQFDPRPRVPNTLRILNQRVPELRFIDTPFEQVIDWLAEFSGLNINVKWRVLEDNGIERDAPISIRVRNLRLSQVLSLIMDTAAGSDIRLAYKASGRLLILSTKDDLDREMVTKVYDVADLLVRIPNAERDSDFDVSQGMGGRGGRGGGGGGGGGGLFGRGGNRDTGDDYDDDEGNQAQLQQLVQLIRDTVEPDSWVENGGEGTIFPFRKLLVVRNTILVHQQLGGYVTEDEVMGQ